MTKFIFVSGGVISGVGKGVIAASLGKLFQEYGYATTIIKADPYINYDAGTLRPTEHGEVWVTDDGGEIDLDLGTYERFLNQDTFKRNNMTTGQVYKSVIDRERAGDYLGATVSFIPHIPDEIMSRIRSAAQGYEIVMIEIGGIIGDYENIPFLFASKSLERELGSDNVAHIMVTYLPIPKLSGEMKTKPTQLAIRMLRQEGIVPDFLMCRAEKPVDDIRKNKIASTMHMSVDNIISVPDLDTVYEMPLHLDREGFGEKVMQRLKLQPKKELNLAPWAQRVAHIKAPENRVKLAVCGKYLGTGTYNLEDSYLSVREALVHAGAELGVGVDITWLRADDMETGRINEAQLKQYAGIVVPGGFGSLGVEGKMKLIEYARTKKVPYLGLCYGMQLACVEYARNVCGMKGAHTTEVDETTKFPIVDLLPEQQGVIDAKGFGGSMRLGGYAALLTVGGRVHELYKATGRLQQDMRVLELLAKDGADHVTAPLQRAIKKGEPVIVERHRHRYEINPAYVARLEESGLLFSGRHIRGDGTALMEFLELLDHPFFVATQAHPEFKSRLGNPSPLFYGFVKACIG
jgi:CTP synthase